MSENHDELQRLLDRFLARWNAGDLPGMAACWLDTGDVVSRQGHLMRGRGAIGELLGELWAKPFSGTRATMTLTSIRALAPDVALIDADMHIVGSRASPGNGPIRMHVVAVARRCDDGWWFESVRPYMLEPTATPGVGAPSTTHPTDETAR